MAASGHLRFVPGAAVAAVVLIAWVATWGGVASAAGTESLTRARATEIGLANLVSNERRIGRRIVPARVLRATRVQAGASYATLGSRLTFPEPWWALEVEGTVLDRDCVPFTSRRCVAGARGLLVVPDRPLEVRTSGFGLFLQSRIAAGERVEKVPLYQFRQVPGARAARARSKRDAMRLARLYVVENARSLGRALAHVSVVPVARLAAGGLHVVDETTKAGLRAARPTWVLEVNGTLANCTPVSGRLRTGAHECRVASHGYVAIPDDAPFPRAVVLGAPVSAVQVDASTTAPGCEVTGGGRLHCRGLP